jgi:hypothetical protein
MQATRVCRITVPSRDTSTTVAPAPVTSTTSAGEARRSLDDVERDTAAAAWEHSFSRLQTGKDLDLDTAAFTISTVSESAGVDEGSERKKPRDPLRMFGLMTPQALRLAQGESVTNVQDIVPKLVEVDAKMKELEIRIRRARKWMGKAE